MTSKEIRNTFLKYFEDRGHRIVPSAPVIPYDDPTLLFTNAGMNQFKDVFLGTGKRDYVRSADSQKCIRVSGKHNDLEEVGRDTYHHTFFEMLGNWSFGDYYKKEAIEWAWDLLTNVWGLEKKRLYATIYETDEEAGELWKKVTDIDPTHIQKFGKKDNFWEMGETGPCGPCSEIHVDLTPDYSGGNLVNAGDPRVMEIWNLVFIQYNRDEKGELTPLPAKHVDTGMGFERICAVLQKKSSNYDTDVFMPIIARIAGLAGKAYTSKLDSPTDIAMRVIADHVRMLSFSIADGGIPSNEGRGYVMRRILRRAARFGRNLGMHEPFIFNVVEAVVRSMGDQYPEIKEKQSHIERVIKGEEESFNVTLDRGIEMHTAEIQRCKRGGEKVFSGEVAFKLHDTFGFPFDLTQLMAEENGVQVDSSTFENLMEDQRRRGREVVKSASVAMDIGSKFNDSLFVGYSELETTSLLSRIIDGRFVSLDKTPFYVESGGQVDDTGVIEGEGFVLQVLKSIKADKKLIHEVKFLKGSYIGSIDVPVRAKVDIFRRHNIERNHSATHLFHEALRRVVGTHAHQQGSLVAPDHLRFDFNHFEKITPGQLKAIEDIVNEKIIQSINVNALNDPKEWLTIEQAKAKYPNIKMFFGDKYGDKVRVVEIDPQFSVELCGGTHVKNTKDIGLFKIISESSIASGIRRIEAVTGDGLRKYIDVQRQKIGELDDQLEKLLEEKSRLEKELGLSSGSPEKVSRAITMTITSTNVSRESVDAAEQMLRGRQQSIENETKRVLDLKKELSKARVKQVSSGLEGLILQGVAVNGFKVVSAKIVVGDAEELKSLGDSLRLKLSSGVGVLGAVVDDKVALVCVVTDDLVKDKKLAAGKIVGELAKRVGGGGGGRPHLATAGGKDVGKLDEALQETVSIVKNML
jgi:alanyl-tRNA synthetase